MKIQCDVCEKAPASVICCADEAALCVNCDIEVHEANKLASKHQRLLLQSLSNKLPRCDICQEKAAFIFCVEDRALFCRDCDEPVHLPGSLSGNHQRLLATGIQVGLSSICSKDSETGHPEPPKRSSSKPVMKVPASQPHAFMPSSWAVDDLLQFSDVEAEDKKEAIGFGDLDWITDIGLYNEQVPQSQEALTAAEVPQLPFTPASNATSYKPTKPFSSHKKPRLQISDDEEFFIVPDLG
ncbi:B-box zinc finger protein 24-like protein isoform X2 [Cinnamomum micranthum f. kanehirae]|uniref:B-box zinc finger protein 24-like protein isoform X2 n=1 Tax=Cinnamomum micranthum f. kanehirae TaxID=337451 RepID=A0A443Q1A9_9MAGN|nr:B-box zinc finger protein 24-like protein isoform X2 [Cinnamomum micranthum f. kanehirae]